VYPTWAHHRLQLINYHLTTDQVIKDYSAKLGPQSFVGLTFKIEENAKNCAAQVANQPSPQMIAWLNEGSILFIRSIDSQRLTNPPFKHVRGDSTT